MAHLPRSCKHGRDGFPMGFPLLIVMQPIASMKRKRDQAVQAILSRNAQIIQALHGL